MRRGHGIAIAAGLGMVLAGCSSGSAPAAAEGDEKVACAIGKDAQFAPVCALERAERAGEQLYIVHHPDGGFRSFTVLANGAGLASADGADPAQQAIAGGLLEVRVGEDRYRFPFKAKADGSH